MLTKPLTLQSDERIIITPNLPEHKVTLAAVSKSAGEVIKKLNDFGINTLLINPNNLLNKCVSAHADIRMLHLSNNCLLCYPEEIDKFSQLSDFSVTGITEQMKKDYPDDVRLNCAVIGDKIICNKKTISKNVLEYAENHSYTVIDVKQGYAKCSICVLNENAIITDDLSIYRAAQNFFDDILLIEKNSIVLKGANYGFIGGCTGKLGKNELAFNGRLESHSNHNEIYDILSKYNIKPIELTSQRLEDIGGILPLFESIK